MRKMIASFVLLLASSSACLAGEYCNSWAVSSNRPFVQAYSGPGFVTPDAWADYDVHAGVPGAKGSSITTQTIAPTEGGGFLVTACATLNVAQDVLIGSNLRDIGSASDGPPHVTKAPD